LFFASRRRHTRFKCDWSSDVCSSDLPAQLGVLDQALIKHPELSGANKGKWRAVFRGQEDEHFQQALDWIKAMYEKRADYPIDYRTEERRVGKDGRSRGREEEEAEQCT